MYEVKRKIFLELTKTQKSALCNFLRAFVKNRINDAISADNILQKFLDDEMYYLEINSSRFEFLREFINEEKFIAEAKLYIKECKKYYDYKKLQEPMIKAQKEFDKRKRKFLQEVKMSKELPTKKQISYYNSLCKRYSLDKKETNALSKLNLRDLINGILNEHQTD